MGVGYYDPDDVSNHDLVTARWERTRQLRANPQTAQQAQVVSQVRANYPHMRAGEIVPLAAAGVAPHDPLVADVATQSARMRKRRTGLWGSVRDVAFAPLRLGASAMDELGEAASFVLKPTARYATAVAMAPFELVQAGVRTAAAVGGEVAAGAASGATVGGAIGLAGGPFAPVSVLAGLVGGGLAGGVAGGVAAMRGVDVKGEVTNPLMQTTLGQHVVGGASIGSGFLVGGEAHHRQAQAARAAASINGHALTPGRMLASAVVEPGSTPYNLLSGLVDASVAMSKIDPAAAALGGVSQYRKGLRSFDVMAEKLAAGAVAGHRKDWIAEAAAEWLNGRQGGAVKDWLARETDFERIRRQLKGVDVDTVAQLTDARSIDQVDGILRPILGRAEGMAMAPRVGDPRLGYRVSRRWQDSRLAQALPSGRLDFNDPNQAVEEFNRLQANMRIPAAERSVANKQLVDHLRVGNKGEARKLVFEHTIGEKSGLFAQADPGLQRRWVQKMWDQDREMARYFIESDSFQTAPHGLVLGGEHQGLALPGLFVDELEDVLAIDKGTIRDMRQATSRFSRLVSTGGWDAVTAVGDAAMTKWRPLVLLRGAWTVRIIAEEQLRMAGAGLNSAFNHPLSYLAMAISDDGTIARVLDKIPGGENIVARLGRAKGGLVEEFVENVDEEAALRGAVNEYTDALGRTQQKRGWLDNDPRRGRFTRTQTQATYRRRPDGTYDTGYHSTWAEHIERLNRDPVARRVANGRPLDEDLAPTHAAPVPEAMRTGGALPVGPPRELTPAERLAGERAAARTGPPEWQTPQPARLQETFLETRAAEAAPAAAPAVRELTPEVRSMVDVLREHGASLGDVSRLPERGWDVVAQLAGLGRPDVAMRRRVLAELGEMRAAPRAAAAPRVRGTLEARLEAAAERPLPPGAPLAAAGGGPVPPRQLTPAQRLAAERAAQPGQVPTGPQPVARQLGLAGMEEAGPTALYNWFENGSGAELRARLLQEPGGQALGTRAGVEDFFANTRRQVDKVTAADPHIAAAIVEGELDGVPIRLRNGKLNPEFVKKLEQRTATGPEALVGDGFKRSDMQSRYDKATGWLFDHLMGIPTARMSRSVAFKQSYWSSVEARMLSATAEDQARIIAEARHWNLAPDQIARLEAKAAKGAGEMTLEEIDLISKREGLNFTKQLLYDSAERGQLSDILRLVFPFLEAQKEVMTRWAKLGTENPKILRRATQVIQGARGTGFFYKDPTTGEEMFAYPGSEILTEKLLGVPIKLGGAVKGLSFFGSGIMPGVGPAIQIPARWLLSDKPEYDQLRDLIDPMGQLQGEAEAGPEESLFGAFVPAWARKVWTAVQAPEDDRVFANSVSDIWRSGVSAGRYSAATEVDIREGLEDARGKARILFLARGLATLGGSPVAITPEYMAKDSSGRWHIADILRQDYRTMLDADADNANTAFLEKYGDNAFAYMQSYTYTLTAAPTSPEASAWVRANPGLAEKYPSVYGFFAPQGEGFDYQSYLRQIREGERIPLKPEEFASLAQNRVGQMVYFNLKDSFGPSPTKPQREFLTQARDLVRQALPGFDAHLPLPEKYRPDELVRDLREAVDDPDLADNEVTSALRLYFQARDALDAQAQAAGWKSFTQPVQARPLRDWMRNFGEQLAERVPDFRVVWDRALDREMRDDGGQEEASARAV